MARARAGNPASLANNSSIPVQIQRALRKVSQGNGQPEQGEQSGTPGKPEEQQLTSAEMQRVARYVKAQLQGSGAFGAQVGLAADKPTGLSAQQAGYLYWESDTNHMRVWTGTAWGTVS